MWGFCPQLLFANTRTMVTEQRALSRKSQTFGLGQTNRTDIFGGILGTRIFGTFGPIMFALWVWVGFGAS
jgi:hypothetical protein